MLRPQFTLKTMLWLTVCAACFFGGIRAEREIERRRYYSSDLGIPFPQGSFGGGVTAPDAKSGSPRSAIHQ